MESQSIKDALLEYKSDLESTEDAVKANQIHTQTRTAIVRHLLPGWDESLMPSSSRQLTKTEREQIDQFLEKTPASKLSEALKVQQIVFEKYNVTQNSRNVYKSRLENFIDWVKKQGWIKSSSGRSPWHQAPRMLHGHGGAEKKLLTNRQTKLDKYSLKTHSCWNTQQIEKLVEEVNQFNECLVEEQYPGRLFDPLKPDSVDRYVTQLYQIFGWLVNYKNIQPEESSLNLLVPTSLEALDNNLKLMVFTEPLKKLIKQKDSLEDQIAQYVDTWICQLLKFLKKERHCQSAHTLQLFLGSIQLLVRYQYIGKTKEANYKDIPVMVVVNKHRTACCKTIKTQQPVANLEMKWLDLDKVHTQIVEPLRLECEFRGVDSQLRSITAIARSFKRFLAWGLLTYRPPRRQQELRELKIALYCEINDKPKNLAPNQFIQPLPRDRNTDKYHGYLYKDRDGYWYQDMTAEGYKTGKTYGLQKLRIPNPKFPDGTEFYDYLEAYLYGYWRDRQGNWVSAVSTTKAPSAGHQLYPLRMALRLKNDHNFVFFGTRNGEPFNNSDFGDFFKKSAHRLTGQLLTPHLLRDIYASWFLDRAYTEDIIRSLAYAMGHSVEEMRRTYDKRKAQRKYEPIQQKLDETISQLIGFNEVVTMASDTPPAGADPVAWRLLTPEQKTKYRNLIAA
jgi:hypothetical protein